MVGGDEAAFARVRPVLDCMGNPKRIVHIGAAGAGQICKVCNQIAIGGALAGVSEAFALATQAGRRRGARAPGSSRRLRGEPGARSPRRADADGQLCAGLPHAAVSEGPPHRERVRPRPTPSRSPATAVVTQLVNALVAGGGADLDYAALGTVLFGMSGVKS